MLHNVLHNVVLCNALHMCNAALHMCVMQNLVHMCNGLCNDSETVRHYTHDYTCVMAFRNGKALHMCNIVPSS